MNLCPKLRHCCWTELSQDSGGSCGTGREGAAYCAAGPHTTHTPHTRTHAPHHTAHHHAPTTTHRPHTPHRTHCRTRLPPHHIPPFHAQLAPNTYARHASTTCCAPALRTPPPAARARLPFVPGPAACDACCGRAGRGGRAAWRMTLAFAPRKRNNNRVTYHLLSRPSALRRCRGVLPPRAGGGAVTLLPQ